MVYELSHGQLAQPESLYKATKDSGTVQSQSIPLSVVIIQRFKCSPLALVDVGRWWQVRVGALVFDQRFDRRRVRGQF